MPAASHPVIAIDGTAASGKSTFARELARRLGFEYVNTGAMYRGVTWYLQEQGLPLEDPAEVGRRLPPLALAMQREQGEFFFSIAGIDTREQARLGRVNAAVSVVAQVPAVRLLLVAEQQKLAATAPLVMEGRDIGTVVFPNTPYKFFVDADAATRAQRRSAQGEADVIAQRDGLDSGRANSPLVCAPDAFRLDSGRLNPGEMITAALAELEGRGLPIPVGR